MKSERQPAGRADLTYIGSGLVRPECVLAVASGELFVANGNGGVSTIWPDGRVDTLIARDAPSDFKPNGIALLADRSFAIANLGEDGGVWNLRRDGVLSPMLQRVDGWDLPPTNFVGLDNLGRLWVTVSTRRNPRNQSLSKDVAPDGCVILIDEGGARIVADDIAYTNEAKVDPSGAFLYINETVGRRLFRHALRPDGELGARETVAEFGHGTFPDGMDFDNAGGIWITSVVSNRLIRVDTVSGDTTLVFEDVEAEHLAEAEDIFRSGRPARLDPGKGRLGNIASLAFGGPDMRTIYLGTLGEETLPVLRSQWTGAQPPHWNF
ncbi:MAG: SMP-30/gluconolactonase/LRE family protein [Mesorhizobium sp.]